MSVKNGFFRATAEDFQKIPGSPIAYWLHPREYDIMESAEKASTYGESKQGLITSDNNRFLRFWYEIAFSKIGKKWFHYNKGGGFRRWFGYREYVVNWENNGFEIRNCFDGNGRLLSRPQNTEKFFNPSLTWSDISSATFAMRDIDNSFIFDASGPSFFPFNSSDKDWLLAAFNTCLANNFLKVIGPGMHYSTGHIPLIPIVKPNDQVQCQSLISLSRTDWDSYETSWDFKENPLVAEARRFGEIMLSDVYDVVRINWAKATVKMRELEIRNNEIFIKAYGLEGELSPDVPWNEVSLTCNPWYRYGREVPENVDAGIYGVASEMPMDADLEKRLRADTAKELVSYAVGCMMGRYSLDRPGLVLADAGGTLADYRAKLREAGVETPRFEPDEDGIIPILDADWFEDDVVTRFHAFLHAAFGEASFHANIAWLEEALGKDLRTYFVKDFYADHVQRYQKRPIYWLFSSRKGAFQALVCLHRYRPDTPGRVLGYLRSYIAKVAARIEALDRIAADPSAARGTRTAALRERSKLAKAQAEIADYERDVLYPLSTERPALDLDDGVKANYPKLGAALRKIF